MAKSYQMTSVNLKLITPGSEEEIQTHWADIEFLHHFFPFKMSKEDLKAFIYTRIGGVTLVYANHILIGAFMIDEYQGSAELHGIARPDMSQVIPGHKRLKYHIFRLILNNVFQVMNKPKLIIKAEPENTGVKGFALMFGFHKLPNKDKGRNIWVLTKERYFERLKAKELITNG